MIIQSVATLEANLSTIISPITSTPNPNELASPKKNPRRTGKRRSAEQLPSILELHQMLSYDPATGILRHKPRPEVTSQQRGWNLRYAGRVAGTLHPMGYRKVTLHRVSFAAHRVIWAMMTGTWPVNLVDQKNGDPDDNRWVNLRQINDHENAVKRRRKPPTSGYRGVYPSGKRWVAMIKQDGKLRRLGLYDDPREAHAAYVAQAYKIHGDMAVVR